MALTLLKMVQRCLSATDSQSVTDVSASPEAEQVVLIINRVYEEIINHRDWPFLRKVGTSLVTNTPGVAWELEMPSDMMNLELVRYNKKDLIHISPIDFNNKVDSRDTTTSFTNSSGIHTDRDPSYWTTIDEGSILFDGYDSTNATLLPSLCYVQYIREVTSELTANTDVPELPKVYHNVLLDGALALCFSELTQDSQKAQAYDRKYKVGTTRMNRWARKVKPDIPNYRSVYDFGRRAVL